MSLKDFSAQHPLARDRQALAARSENPGRRTLRGDGSRKIGHDFEHVFAVIQDEQDRAVPQRVDHGLGDRLARLLDRTDHIGDHMRYPVFQRHRGKLGQPRSVAKPWK